MPRQPRQNQKDVTFYHIMVQGINKEYIFNDEKLIKKYLSLVLENCKKFDIRIIAYCIMNNHVHLLVYSKNINIMSKMMQKTNMAYARYYNWVKSRVGYVFRDRYLSQPIINETQLIKCVKYIHDNPVKAKMVKKAEQYKFSNCKQFYSKKNLEQLKEIVNIDFGQIQLVEPYIEGEFIEQEIDIKEQIYGNIRRFCQQEKIRVIKIFESRKILKKLIRYLKENCKIKYTDIMDIMEISPGVMGNLKKGE